MSLLKDLWGKSADYLLISGPCSAESRDQLLATALALKSYGRVHALRAGIWKPRTRPDSFEGIGKDALPWLVEAGKLTGLPVITEVALASHVEACLEAGIDGLWIGARTAANPFSVQEIADALRGTSVPVLVKNPINPDLALWIGAIERVRKAGVSTVAAVHRGFSIHGTRVFRNVPMWEIAIAMRAHFPEMEMICDPSHIAGKRDLVRTVAQYALDLNYEGLMIESHCNPAVALSDKDQQLLPADLEKILESLVFRKLDSGKVDYANALRSLRENIDRIDFQILQLLAERMGKIEELGLHKKENNISILQMERWQEILSSRKEWGHEMGIHPDFLMKILEQIHAESIRKQNAVFSSNENPSEA